MRRRNRKGRKICRKQVILFVVLITIFCILPEPEFNTARHPNLHAATVKSKITIAEVSESGLDHTVTIKIGRQYHPSTEDVSQIIAILPGPHKTGTTSVQAALYRWMNRKYMGISADEGHNKLTDSAFQNWSYPIPVLENTSSSSSNVDWSATDRKVILDGKKGFAPMITRLFGNLVEAKNPAQNVAAREIPLVKHYVQSLQYAWDQGYSVVLASEHLDRLAMEETKSRSQNAAGGFFMQATPASTTTPNQLWERVVDCLPRSHREVNKASSSLPKIVVGVQHRTPRIDHLMSMWHHLGTRNQSFLDFLTKPKKPGSLTASSPHSLNSLGLADFFFQRGFEVVIIDIGGVQQRRLDLPVVVACEVLKVPCRSIMTEDGSDDPMSKIILEKNEKEKSQWSNSTRRSSLPGNSAFSNFTSKKDDSSPRLNHRPKPGAIGIDNVTMQRIEHILLEYDCQLLREWNNAARSGTMRIGTISWVYGEMTTRHCSKFPPKKAFFNTKKLFSETIWDIVSFVCLQHPQSKHCRST